ncbi:type II toxin-antitoxin system VapC family toxin [Mycolicibacterium parafortuitum]|uniref:type II toxin-antitoxin system VapC family toxin n=1 Tax=Mycolicibacterium parafortuitum TaxID=39692 RepID=UPI0032C40EF6
MIYVDTCVFLDMLFTRTKPHPATGEPRWKSAKALFEAIYDGRVHLATSALVETELGCFADVRDGGSEIHDKVRSYLDAPPPSTLYVEVDRSLARDAVRLSRMLHQQDPEAKQLKSLDAVHMAAAVRLHANYLMTQDGAFPIGHTVEGVDVRWTEIVWPAGLWDESVASA